MSSNESKQSDPLQNIFSDIKKILDFIEVKDVKEALKYETTETRDMAELWLNATVEADSYITYRNWWTPDMFQEVVPNAKYVDIQYLMDNPYEIPLKYRDNLLTRGRQAFLDQYVEKNDYYRMLNGLPPFNTDPSDYIYLTEPIRNKLHIDEEGIPVHELSPLIQNNYMSTDEYKEVLAANPDKTYLKFLGMYKVDVYTARIAKDFEIIRYPTNRSDINPNLLNIFANLYADYREYVMVTLYNEQLENVYANYRTFMGVVIMSFTLLQVGNKAVEAVNSRRYLDDAILHIVLSMYGIPEELLLTTEVRRELAINMLKLVQEKATDDVYYDLIRILGYQEVAVSKLLLMKGQQFDPDNNYNALDESKPYFIQIDLKDTNPYETIINGKAPIHSYEKITGPDPMWWDLQDVKDKIANSNFTMSDSKYIMVEAMVHQMKYMFEAIYFTRLIIDNKYATDTFLIEIPELFGIEPVSVYDLLVFLICATCINNGLSGEIVSETDRIMATAGFNFDMDLDSFIEFLETTKYVDKDRLMIFMENLTMKDQSDISRLFNDVMYPLREWLESKIANASCRQEYIEYEAIYRAMFTYDLTRNPFISDYDPPLDIIRKRLEISEEDLKAYQHFYPRHVDGTPITYTEYDAHNETLRYQVPFLSTRNRLDWYIDVIPDGQTASRGKLYFHDIINSSDIRYIKNEYGDYIFLDWDSGEEDWVLNRQAVTKVRDALNNLNSEALKDAYFQVKTFVLGGEEEEAYEEGEKLPQSIRSGLYKDILVQKFDLDIAGFAEPAKTYQGYLYRKNPKLYDLLSIKDTNDEDRWLNTIMTIVTVVESELNVHMKYFEQSILGEQLFFKPLIMLIKHFKSSLVDFAKTGMTYVFADKIDSGGNSNMFKLFDEVDVMIHFTILASSGYNSQFGFFDTTHSTKHKIMLKDRSEILRMIKGEGFLAEVREARMGSIRMVDEAKFYKNGEPLDPSGQYSYWSSGEPGTGRWSEEDDFLMQARTKTERIHNYPVDLDGWKESRG